MPCKPGRERLYLPALIAGVIAQTVSRQGPIRESVECSLPHVLARHQADSMSCSLGLGFSARRNLLSRLPSETYNTFAAFGRS